MAISTGRIYRITTDGRWRTSSRRWFSLRTITFSTKALKQTPKVKCALATTHWFINLIYTGLAIIETGCGSSYELGIIVQARSYRTAFIFAHELGHRLERVQTPACSLSLSSLLSIGLKHDEDLGCGSGHIMSASTGPGKNRFSRCSFDELTRIFTILFVSP